MHTTPSEQLVERPDVVSRSRFGHMFYREHGKKISNSPKLKVQFDSSHETLRMSLVKSRACLQRYPDFIRFVPCPLAVLQTVQQALITIIIQYREGNRRKREKRLLSSSTLLRHRDYFIIPKKNRRKKKNGRSLANR